MRMSNAKMEQYIDVMSGLTETGKLGYAIARNTRKLKEAAKDYLKIKGDLLQKYGVMSNDGKRFVVSGDNFPKFISELGDIPDIEHDVDIFQVPEELFFGGTLTSQQMENLLWMVEGGSE